MNKAKKTFLLGCASLSLGLILFYFAVSFWLPIIGITGFVLIINGAIDTLDGVFKIMRERIEYNKFRKSREQIMKVEIKPYKGDKASLKDNECVEVKKTEYGLIENNLKYDKTKDENIK